MVKFTIAGATLMMLIPGVLYLIAPSMMLATPEISLKTINEFHLVRAAYGGGFLGIATLFALGAFRPSQQTLSLTAIAVVLTGFALGRLYSIFADGIPTMLFVGVLVAEGFFAGLAFMALRANR